MTRSNSLGTRFVRKTYQKMLTRGFNKKQKKELLKMLEKYEKANPNCFVGVPRDPSKYEEFIKEFNTRFLNWCEENIPLNPEVWEK